MFRKSERFNIGGKFAFGKFFFCFLFCFKHNYFARFPLKISRRSKQMFELLYVDIWGNFEPFYYVNKTNTILQLPCQNVSLLCIC